MRGLLIWLLSAVLTFNLLPGFAAAGETQLSPSLQLRQPPQAPVQNRQQPVAQASLHDIHGPIVLPEPVPHLFLGLGGLAALVLLFGLYWWLSRKRKAKTVVIPPSMRARDELMRAREYMNPTQAVVYMERISEILRGYLEARFALRTSRQTTREFFATLTGRITEHPGLAAAAPALRTCLEQCDLAKFAHRPASVEHLQEMENSVLGFVNETEEVAPAKTTRSGR